MIRFTYYNRVKRYFKRHIFNMLFSKSFYKFGKNISIVNPDIIEGEKYITLEDNVSFNTGMWILVLKQNNSIPKLIVQQGATIGRFVHIVAIDEVVIEKNVLIADKVYISDNLHGYTNPSIAIKEQPILFKGKVFIGDNSWIGENVSIIGAKIGKHCVIGANSVVTRDIPSFSVAVGNPAKVIKKYNFEMKIWEKI